eukprot:m.71807 g.71807  ORF g.71807 m.71807 type:complete len:467 (-) comp7967_c0_seq3:194-1594(-)
MASREEMVRARELAHALFDLRGYRKSEVFAQIAAKSQFSGIVLKCYLELFDFRQLDLVQAMRRLFSRFSIQGESHEIDRVIRGFASTYHEQNNMDCSVDAAYCLASAVLLLNTDLHNPQVERKMSLNEFCRNLSGMRDGADFDRGLLKDIYAAIRKSPLPVAMDDESQKAGMETPAQQLHCHMRPGRPEDPLRIFFLGDDLGSKLLDGILHRKDTVDSARQRVSAFKRSWKEFFVSLVGGRLIFHLLQDQPFTAEECTQNMYDAVLVRHALAREALEYEKRASVFELTLSSGQTMLLQAQSDADMSKWIESINTVAALESAPPLAAAVSSSTLAIQPPVLPESKSQASPEEQLETFKVQLRKQTKSRQHHQELFDSAMSSKARQKAWEQKAAFLDFAQARYAKYVEILTNMNSRTSGLLMRRHSSVASASPTFHFRPGSRSSSLSSDQGLTNLYYGYERHEKISWV